MLSKIKSKLNIQHIAVLLFSSYLLINTYNVYFFHLSILDIHTANRAINPGFFILRVLALCAVLLAAYVLINYNNFHRAVLFCSSMSYAVGLAALRTDIDRHFNLGFVIVICAVLFYILNYCFREPDGITFRFLDKKITFAHVLIFITAAAVVYSVAVGWASVMRFYTFRAGSFDFGIFAQMFESMARNGTQVTTVERNMELSHFAVHVSPIFYLLLPFYMLFRTPESLLVMQAVLIASAVYPLALIARRFDLRNIHIIFITLAYLFYPAITGGAFFDFHENKFLTVLVLWLLYFIITERAVPMYIFAVLTLGVKEDAFLYVICAAVYVMAVNYGKNKKMLIHGAVLSGLSVCYFMFAVWFLRTFGHGVMIFRYYLFLMLHEESFIAIMRNVIINPALILDSVLSVPAKLEFALYMFIPLCFLPFAGKNIKFAIMLIAMIIINLATDYVYQYNINFHYTYGVTALLFFLTLKHLSGINRKHSTKLCVMAACFSCIIFMSTQYDKLHAFHRIYSDPTIGAEYRETREILARIPDGASVTGTMFITPHLSRLEQLFAVDLYDEDFFDYGTEFIIIDTRLGSASMHRRRFNEMYERGYRLVESGGIIEVFRLLPGDGE